MKQAFRYVFFLIIAVGLLIRAFAFGSTPFYDWDESIYTQVSREISRSHSLTMSYNGRVWLEKPVYLPALLSLLYLVPVSQELTARVLMSIFAFSLALLLYILTTTIAIRLFPEQLKKMNPYEQELAFCLPVLGLVSSMLFLDKSTSVNFDLLLAIGWVGYFTYRDNYYAKLLFLSIGVAGKSLLGFYPLFTDALMIRRKDITLRNVGKTLLLIILPVNWHISSYIQFGDQFIQEHITDHMIKRVTTPIELKFGGKIFYIKGLWEDTHINLVLIIIGFSILASVLGKLLLNKRFEIFEEKSFWYYLVLLSPLPFFAFLTSAKSKLVWYLLPTLPLFMLIITYLYLSIRKICLKIIVVVIVLFPALHHFISQTYLLNPSITLPEKTTLALCMGLYKNQNVAVLVDEDERNIRDFIEPAHMAIGSSFVYGGSPAFIYYVDKPVTFYYKPEEFINTLPKEQSLVVSRKDIVAFPEIEQAVAQLQSPCTTENWVAYIR